MTKATKLNMETANRAGFICAALAALAIVFALANATVGGAQPAYAEEQAGEYAAGRADFTKPQVAEGEGSAAASLDSILSLVSDTSAQAHGAVWDGTADTSWYTANLNASSYTITTAEQLAGLAAITNGTAPGIARTDFSGKTIVLGADIVLNATSATGQDSTQRQWTPIGHVIQTKDMSETENGMPAYDYSGCFNGTFDGTGHKVLNIYKVTAAENYGGYSGLFGALGENAVVKNMGLEGGYVYGRIAGGIAACSHVRAAATSEPIISGCYNSAKVYGNGSSMRGVGGIFGGGGMYIPSQDVFQGRATIVSCINMGDIVAHGCPGGGIAGYGSLHIASCLNEGRVLEAGELSGAIAGSILQKGYINPSHPEGMDAVTDTFSGYVRNSNAKEGTFVPALEGDPVALYRVFAGDNNTITPTTAAASADVYFLVGYPWYAISVDSDFSLGGAFDIVDVDNSAYYLRLWWMEDGNSTALNLNDIYQLHVENVPDHIYDGTAYEPELDIWYNDDVYYTHDLVQGADFTVAYADNVNVGTGSATVTGMGRYTGTIDPVPISIVTGGIESYCHIEPIYDQWFYGEAVTPAVKVVTNSGNVLDTSNYDVTWKDNDKAGTATATVTAKAPLTGTLTCDFKLVQASASLEGAGTAENPYKLGSKADLQFLAHAINTGDATGAYSTAHYQLTADIVAKATEDSNLAVDPISYGKKVSDEHLFGGTIDGGGHYIELGIDEEVAAASLNRGAGDTAAFISRAQGGLVIKNLTLKGAVQSPLSAAAFVGYSTNAGGVITFENCTNEATVSGAGYSSGDAGFVYAPAGGVSFTGCTNAGRIEADQAFTDNRSSKGGIAAGFVAQLMAAPATFTDCKNTGTVLAGRQTGGGFIGEVSSYVTGNVTFTNCGNEGTVSEGSGAGHVAGFVGAPSASGSFSYAPVQYTFNKCYNKGAIDVCRAYGVSYAGGFVGDLLGNVTFTDCYNTGALTEHPHADSRISSMPACRGGFVGFMGKNDNATVTFTRVYSAGDSPAGEDGISGAFVGRAWHGAITLSSAYHTEAAGADALGDPDYGFKTVSGVALVKTAEEMKDAAFCYLLGEAFSPDSGNVNGGFPILHDRAATHFEKECTFSFPDNTANTSEPGRQSFNGAFNVNVKVMDGATALEEGANYEVSYQVIGDAKAQVVVTGKGEGYAGARFFAFDFDKCNVADCIIAGAQDNPKWNEATKTFEPAIVVKSPANSALASGTDYSIEYIDSNGVRKARVVGAGSCYTGVSAPVAIKTYDLTGATIADGIDDAYEFRYNGPLVYPQYLHAVKGTSDIYSGNLACFLRWTDAQGDEQEAPLDGTQLGVVPAGELQVVLKGTGCWAGETASKTVTFGRDLATSTRLDGIPDLVAQSDDGIDMSNVKLVAVSAHAEEVVDSREYTITFANVVGQSVKPDRITREGTYTYTVTPTGAYVDGAGEVHDGNCSQWFGELTGTFDVLSAEYIITGATIEGIDASYLKTGSPITPKPTSVTLADGSQLKPVYYRVTYEDADGNVVDEPVNAGTYTLVVTGKGFYMGRATTQFTIEEPYFAVYRQTGTGQVQIAKTYTKADLEALAAKDAEPVSALYGRDAFHVLTATSYVTMDALLADAGVTEWKAGSATTVRAGTLDPGTSTEREYTYDAAHALYFYPATGPSATSSLDYDTLGEKAVPMVVALKHASCEVLATASVAEQDNIAAANASNEQPRLLTGVARAEYAAHDTSKLAGSRLVKNMSSVVVRVVEGGSPDGPDGPDGQDNPDNPQPTAVDLSGAKVSVPKASMFYTSKPITQDVTVVLDGKTLVEGTDFTVAWADNVDVGTATGTVTGKGAYKGTAAATVAFAIEHCELTGTLTDLKADAWYMNEIGGQGAFPGTKTRYLDYTMANGLMTGKKNADGSITTFDPEGYLTRAETAMVLFRLGNPGAENGADASTCDDMPDVASGQWYTRAVNWCVANHIMTGYTDDAGRAYAFGTNDLVTREQLATIIGRYCMEKAGKPYAGDDVSAFKDRAQISGWARVGIAFCNKNGIMTGLGDSGNFGPQDKAQRCQMAKIIAVTHKMVNS